MNNNGLPHDYRVNEALDNDKNLYTNWEKLNIKPLQNFNKELSYKNIAYENVAD
jgi:hypothetical protein